jgi:hypothetical protein
MYMCRCTFVCDRVDVQNLSVIMCIGETVWSLCACMLVVKSPLHAHNTLGLSSVKEPQLSSVVRLWHGFKVASALLQLHCKSC